MNVTRTEVQETTRGLIVLVDATGPRGGERQYTVGYTRRRLFEFCVMTSPAVTFHPTRDSTPDEVLRAADKAVGI